MEKKFYALKINRPDELTQIYLLAHKESFGLSGMLGG